MKDDWDEKLKQQVERRFEQYKTVRLDLTDAHQDFLWTIAGNFIYVEKVSSVSAEAQIKLNYTRADTINLFLHTRIKTMFTALYITNTAQAGEWIELLIGCEFEMFRADPGRNIESQACVVLTNVAANVNTPGPAQLCDIVLFKADVANVGVVWVDFGAAAVQNACLPMDPGDWSRHHLSNLNQLNANFEIANERLIVVPEI